MKHLLLTILLLSACDEVMSIDLSASDHEFIEDFFDGQIDDVHYFESDRLEPDGRAIGNTVIFASRVNVKAHMRQRPLIVRELTHVLQWQRKEWGSKDEGYYFGLWDNDSIKDYGTEQQAEIMSAYYLISYDTLPYSCVDCDEYPMELITERLTELYEEML